MRRCSRLVRGWAKSSAPRSLECQWPACEFSAFPPTDSLSVDADESGKCALRDAKLFS